jgi:Ca2+-transporting ATPase
VNDGPALKAAHIGVAMGHKGSEVARQAASIILTNDDLSSMVHAVAFGRRIYSNLKKAIQYIISIHIPLISIVTLPLLLGWIYPNIFTPVHVIFLELVMGPTCSIAFENEPMEAGLMSRKPRKLSSELFTWRELSLSVIQGLVITAGLLYILNYAIHLNYDEYTARTMVFSTLIFSNILLTLTGRSRIYSLFTTLKYRNKLIPLIIFITLFIFCLAVFYPPMQSVFSFTAIGFRTISYCFLVAAVSVLWIEIYKLLRKS